MWEYVCPLCNERVKTKHDLETANGHIGSTLDCQLCQGLLIIEDDLSVTDFGEVLVKRYAEAGLEVSKEQATGSFIEF